MKKAAVAVLLAVSSLYITSANITASLPKRVDVFNNRPDVLEYIRPIYALEFFSSFTVRI